MNNSSVVILHVFENSVVTSSVHTIYKPAKGVQ